MRRRATRQQRSGDHLHPFVGYRWRSENFGREAIPVFTFLRRVFLFEAPAPLYWTGLVHPQPKYQIIMAKKSPKSAAPKKAAKKAAPKKKTAKKK
ncbi:MAG: hypothetical protein QM691_02595 [Opitutaceae bacterium]